MNTKEIISKGLKKLRTAESKEEAKRICSEYNEKVKKEEEIKKDILSDERYILWLDCFILKNGAFNDVDKLSYAGKLSDLDRQNIDRLCLFYKIVDSYAQRNYILAQKHKKLSGKCYFIKHRNVGYQIGMMCGKGTLFYCGIVPLNEKGITYIAYDDIRNDKKQYGVEKMDKNLKLLSEYIQVISNDIPMEFIDKIVRETIDGVKTEEVQKKEKHKVLKK